MNWNKRYTAGVYLIVWGWLFLFFSACQTHSPAENDMVSPDFYATKNSPVETGTTYRIAAYHIAPDLSYVSSGSYCVVDQQTKLEPSRLDADGIFIALDQQSGLTVPDGNYALAYLSPGIDLNQDGSVSFIPGQETCPFKISEPEEHYIGDFGLIPVTGGLKDPRSKIAFSIFSKRKVEMQGNVTVAGAPAAGTSVSFNPSDRRVTLFNTATSLILTQNADPVPVEHPEGSLCYQTHTGFVSAGRYSSGLSLVCTMKVSGLVREVDIPLTGERLPELEQQHSYMFDIVVSTNNVGVTVKVFDGSLNQNWQAGGIDEVEISQPGTMTIDLGTWKLVNGNQWVEIRPGEILIE